MARTITEIQQAITSNLQTRLPGLSTSKTGEWSLWAYIVAVAIQSFEIILDLFRKEMDELTDKITPGTLRWYAEMAKRFQNGDSLEFDQNTALLYYPVDNPEKRIIEVAAVSESTGESNVLFIKVAKKDDAGNIVELTSDELYNFKAYIDAIKFAGCTTEVISTNADQIYYDMTVYHDPSIPSQTIRDNTEQVLQDFKTNIDFDGVVYRQKILDAVMAVPGVTTVVMDTLEQHSYQSKGDDDWTTVTTHATLDAGYFDWADGSVDGKKCNITVKTVNELLNGK